MWEVVLKHCDTTGLTINRAERERERLLITNKKGNTILKHESCIRGREGEREVREIGIEVNWKGQ